MAGTSGLPMNCRTPPAADARSCARWQAAALRAVCRYVLACAFLMAAVTKITDMHGFADLMQTRSGLAYWPALLTAAFLPWLELTCAACLLSGKAVREAATVLAAVLVALLLFSLTHLREPDCGCWVFPKIGTETVWWWPPLRNGILLLCSTAVAWNRSSARPP
jgi:uncharacterized membrane protein YphA (DoxX/SURF4 family)